jgi:isopropylmalate/homocitrate/citramalate synthase
MGRTPAGDRRKLQENIALARSAGLDVRVGVEDFFGRPLRDCFELYAAAEAAGAARLALADTLGKAQGWEVARRVAALRRRTALDIEAHFHNDLGQAVSNAVWAVRCGANWISASLLGIGERTGSRRCPPFWPTSMFSIRSWRPLPDGGAHGCRGPCLAPLRDRCPHHLMTSPANGFAHKAGIHLDALMKFGPGKYEPLSPRVVGNVRRLVLIP